MPLSTVPAEIRQALDPQNASALSTSWSSATPQWCPPYGGQPFSSRPGYGQTWLGLSCGDTAPFGGVATLSLMPPTFQGSGMLRGSLPAQLRELRAATQVFIREQALTGTLPSVWGTTILSTTSGLGLTPGFDSLSSLRIDGNLLNGSIPASWGSLSPTPSAVSIWFSNNLLSGANLL